MNIFRPFKHLLFTNIAPIWKENAQNIVQVLPHYFTIITHTTIILTLFGLRVFEWSTLNNHQTFKFQHCLIKLVFKSRYYIEKLDVHTNRGHGRKILLYKKLVAAPHTMTLYSRVWTTQFWNSVLKLTKKEYNL